MLVGVQTRKRVIQFELARGNPWYHRIFAHFWYTASKSMQEGEPKVPEAQEDQEGVF
jgi:hypothetical protein